jgi:hypothetical protein
MKKQVFLALTLFAALTGTIALPIRLVAQTPTAAPTPVPVIKPDFSTMMFLTGTWTCHQPLRGGDRPDTSTTTMSADGVWMVTQDTAPPFDKYRTYAIHGTSYLGWDPTIKQWVQVGVDSSGGYGISSSPGWTGNTIMWTTKNLDGSSGTDTITKVSDTETNDASSATDTKGAVTTVAIHCVKSGS